MPSVTKIEDKIKMLEKSDLPAPVKAQELARLQALQAQGVQAK